MAMTSSSAATADVGEGAFKPGDALKFGASQDFDSAEQHY